MSWLYQGVRGPTCSLGPSRSMVAKEREEGGRMEEEVALDTRVGSMSTPRLTTCGEGRHILSCYKENTCPSLNVYLPVPLCEQGV